MIEFHNVTLIRQLRTSVVAPVMDLSFAVHSGEVVAVTGGFASGKTSVIRLACGLIPPTQGEVRANGRILDRLGELGRAQLRRNFFGVMLQPIDLIANLTVLENVLLPASIAGISAHESHHRARILLQRIGMESLAKELPAGLSSGECQLVAFVRAVINSPRVLLADDPTNSLDHDRSRYILDRIREFARREGSCVLMTTDSPLACAIADRIVELPGSGNGLPGKQK